MNIGKAVGIFKNIDNVAIPDAEKVEAINEVIHLDTHNGITKADMLKALNWSMRYNFFLECQNISLKKVNELLKNGGDQ